MFGNNPLGKILSNVVQKKFGNSVEDALVTGPLLIKNNQINELQKRPFNDLKHPRSAICLKHFFFS